MIKLLVYAAAIGGCGYAGYAYGQSIDKKAASTATTTTTTTTV